jgi:hypothetical protein
VISGVSPGIIKLHINCLALTSRNKRTNRSYIEPQFILLGLFDPLRMWPIGCPETSI